MTQKEYERAKQLGYQAARAGKKLTDSPWGKSPALRDMHHAWVTGFNEGKRK